MAVKTSADTSSLVPRIMLHGELPADAPIAEIVGQRLASRLFAKDSGLWSSGLESSASRSLGWLTIPPPALDLIEGARNLRTELLADGLDQLVLCGMGGNALAAIAISKLASVPLTVLDTTHPGAVARVVRQDLRRTVMVVSSKSGQTIETDALLRAFTDAFRAQGIDPAERLVAVTDPGSMLTERASEFRALFLADPEIGGRYSALAAFGMVPTTLAGADVVPLLQAATTSAQDLAVDDRTNPAVRLAAILASDPGQLVLTLTDSPTSPGVADWLEQLVAESLGKQGIGVLPVVAKDPEAVAAQSATTAGAIDVSFRAGQRSYRTSGGLGSTFLLWEAATAMAGSALGVNPFDQPDVEAAKQATRELLARPRGEQPALRHPPITVFDGRPRASSLREAVRSFIEATSVEGYLAVMAYADPYRDRELANLRDLIAARIDRPVTFGWGPRFLHSTGQYHKGGPPNGAFLQILVRPASDVEVSGQEYSFGSLIQAQAAGDSLLLRSLGRPLLELHVDPSPKASFDLLRDLF